MVQSVTGSNLLAVFPASATARNLAQQNLVLPSPLNSPEQQAQQRASAIIRFNAPTLSNSTLATLQDAALRAQVAPEIDGRTTAADSDSALRASQAYSQAANSLRPLVALGTAQSPGIPSPQALVPGAAEEAGESRGSRAAERPRSERDGEERGNSARDIIAREQANSSSNPLLPPERQNFAPQSVSSQSQAQSLPVAPPARQSNANTGSLGSSLGVRVDVGV